MRKKIETFSPLFIAALTATFLDTGKRHNLSLSVRFSSRHSLLLCNWSFTCKQLIAFSPLFIAALTATFLDTGKRHNLSLSVRFSSRHSLLLCNWSFTCKQLIAFSPLFIAALTATLSAGRCGLHGRAFQSAFHRGSGCYGSAVDGLNPTGAFSPLFIAAVVVT